MDENNIRAIAKEYADVPLLGFVRAFIREWEATWVDPEDVNHEWGKLYKEAKQIVKAVDTNERTQPKPREQEPFPPFGWRIVNTCLELTFLNRDDAVSALGQLQGLRAQATPGEAERP